MNKIKTNFSTKRSVKSVVIDGAKLILRLSFEMHPSRRNVVRQFSLYVSIAVCCVKKKNSKQKPGDIVISPDNIFLQNDCHMHGMLLPVAYLHAEFQIAVHSEPQILDLDPVLYCSGCEDRYLQWATPAVCLSHR